MTQSFDDAWKENRNAWESTKNLAKAMYLAGAQSRQVEIDELQKKLEDAHQKYNALYNAFIATDDARKEWHSCYMGAREREDELRENIDHINQRAIDQAAHLRRVQEHNAKLQKRLKENNLTWQDLI